jgi:cobyrinic acid a,c-diamide synthase
VLVADARGVSRSIAAAINGFCAFDPSITIAGVIFNNVSGERHYTLLKRIVEQYCSVPSFGYLPADPAIALKSRHLGLVPAEEISNLTETINRMAASASAHLDIDAIVAAAADDDAAAETPAHIVALKNCAEGMRIAIATDKAFSFYYTDNLALMEYTGIELVPFSPLADERVPDGVQGIYLGGGYPEEFAASLSANAALRADIKMHAYAGLPIYAECGGLMYLTDGIQNSDGPFFPMVGFFNCRAEMTGKLQRFGYVTVSAGDCEIRAHEFHHSRLLGEDSDAAMNYMVRKASSDGEWRCGLQKNNVLAAYAHIHFYANIEFFTRLLRRFRREL